VQSVETLIIGAGVSGLATAAAIGRGGDLLVLERDAEVGGYCKTVKQDGFTWDYSGHFFHFKRPEIEQWLRERMQGQEIRTVVKRSLVRVRDGYVDFPFQKNIHQLPREDFVDCLHDLYFARTRQPPLPEGSFQQMLFARYGRGIAERFLIPYNEKLYATDLDRLDREAMGRFFPHADLPDIIRNMKAPDNGGYNATFTYPEGGAIEYVKALQSEVAPGSLRLNEGVAAIDLARKVARTTAGVEVRYRHLVSSAPFPALLRLCGLPVDADTWTWNQVLVLNLGFDRKGPRDVHWIYYPERSLPFYRVGFYDNIFDTDRMSLYVELGYARDAVVDVEAARGRVLEGLRRAGVVTDQQLVSSHHVVMNPAYVHITNRSMEAFTRLSGALSAEGVHSIGRYGGWTYCSIEDNVVEARNLATRLGLARGWPA